MGEPGHTSSRFNTTSWTLVGHANESRGDLEKLLAQYWSPVYAYLRRSGKKPADAEDLTQAFLTDVVLGRGLIEQADRERGRFRSFLISALSRFVIDEYRRERGRRGERGKVFLPEDPEALLAAEPDEGDAPDQAFHRQWATAVLDRALKGVETACRREGLSRHWTAFDERVLRPARQGGAPTPIEELQERLPARSAQEIYSMLQTVKNKLQRELWVVVSETVADADDITRELKELREYLSLDH